MVAFGSRRLEISNMAHRFLRVAGYSIREIGICRRFVSIDRKNLQQHLDGEYTNEPCYPPILDLSRQATKERVAKHRSDKIKQLSTVEERLVELNAPKYYGWWSCCFQEKLIPYNALPFVQFATRTAVERGLPAVYDKLDEEARQATDEIQGQVRDLIIQEFESVVPRYDFLIHWIGL